MGEMVASVLIRFLTEGAGEAKKAVEGIRDAATGFRQGFGQALDTHLNLENIEKAKAEHKRRLSAARGELMDAFGMAMTLALPVKLSMDFEEAFAGVEKVLDAPASRLKELRQYLLDTSAVVPVTAKGLAEIMGAAAEGGIPDGDLEAFTAFAAKASVAFDMAAGEIGERFAKLRNVYKLNQEGIERLGDAANHLSNNMAAKAREVTDFANRAAGAVRTLKLTGIEMEAVGAAMVAAGIAPEVGARGFNAFANKVEKGGKAVEGAFKSVGLSLKSFREALADDAPKAIQHLFETLSKEPKGAKALIDLFGQDFSDDFGKLVGNPELLAEAFRLIANEADYAGSALAEFEKRAATTRGKLQKTLNGLAAAAIGLGDNLLPVFRDILEGITATVNVLGQFAGAHPEAASALVKIAAGMLAFGVASKVFKYGFELARGPLIGLLKIITKMRSGEGVLGLVGKRLAGIGAAAAAHPFIALALAVVAVGAAFLALRDEHAYANQAAEEHAETIARLKAELFGAADAADALGAANARNNLADAYAKATEWKAKLVGQREELFGNLKDTTTRDFFEGLGIGSGDDLGLMERKRLKGSVDRFMAGDMDAQTLAKEIESERLRLASSGEGGGQDFKVLTDIRDQLVAYAARQEDLKGLQDFIATEQKRQSGPAAPRAEGDIPLPTPKPAAAGAAPTGGGNWGGVKADIENAIDASKAADQIKTGGAAAGEALGANANAAINAGAAEAGRVMGRAAAAEISRARISVNVGGIAGARAGALADGAD